MGNRKLYVGISLALGLSFSAFAFADSASAADMHRLYNPNSGEHFYTANVGEKNNLTRVGWKYEGIGWTAPSSGNPVYRLYNANAGDHHYTLNTAEKNNLVKVGWRYEGIGWYSDTKKAVPLYRAYNPNAKAGSHNYTVNNSEQQMLLKAGWKNEGIAWYGIKKTVPITKYKVTVVHKGSNGKTLNTSSTQVEKGKKYTANAGSFSGYTLKGSKTQTVTINGNKTITFTYTKNPAPVVKYNVIVVHKGSDKILETEKTVQVVKDTNYVAKAKAFSDYTLKGNKTQTLKITKNTTITFNYDKVQPIADKTELQKVYNELMNSVELNDYTKDSGNLFRKNTDDIKNNILDKKDVSQNEVDQAIRTLNNLKSEMVYIKDLRLKINNMNQFDKSDYTKSSWIAMNDVLKEANSVLIKSDATQKEVDNFVNKLEEVSADLVNIKVLKAKIDSLYTIAMEDYTQTSWKKFSEILKVAKDIVVQEDVSQENVDSTEKELEEGRSQLVNIKKLRDKVDELKKVKNENYTESSWSSFNDSLKSAISMLENSNASQNDIDTVLSELTYHYSKLEENPKHVADKKWLQELYDAVKDKDLSVYTDGSGEELYWALSGAKSYLKSPEATQYEVDKAHSELLKANNNLVANYDLKQVYNTVSDSIKNLDLSNYNDWQVKTLKEALEEAKAILDERAPTQRKVDDSKMALEDAFKNLEVARCVISIICRDENGNMVGRTDWSAEKGAYFDAEYLDIAFHGYVLDDEPVKRILVTGNMEVDFKYKKANSEEIEMGSIRKKMKEDVISVWRTYRKENGKSDISESQEIQSVANAKAIDFGENPNYVISNEFPSILDSYISKEIIVKAENVTLEWIRSNGTDFIMNEWKKSPEAVDSLLYQDESKNWAEGALACNIVPSSDGKYNVYFVGLIGFTKYQTA
ncbi:MucBP domain-containing protein [Enterococcus hailinensis]|uniref:MucBP domain-containing protein n=1 Tax=Enterococcus hailinensis TaxID=3238988 RepID=UPI0038B256FD